MNHKYMADNVIDKVEKDIKDLTETKKEALQYSNRNAYVREKVFEYKDVWWKKLDDMINSEDKDERRLAMIEYNKLQCRILPTQITGEDGDAIKLNVISWNGTLPSPNKVVEGESINS